MLLTCRQVYGLIKCGYGKGDKWAGLDLHRLDLPFLPRFRINYRLISFSICYYY